MTWVKKSINLCTKQVDFSQVHKIFGFLKSYTSDYGILLFIPIDTSRDQAQTSEIGLTSRQKKRLKEEMKEAEKILRFDPKRYLKSMRQKARPEWFDVNMRKGSRVSFWHPTSPHFADAYTCWQVFFWKCIRIDYTNGEFKCIYFGW